MKSYKGGFVGSNSGRIDDCYSVLGLEGRKAGISGFCGANSGSIRQSFHSGRLGHVEKGFGVGGTQENCFFFAGGGEAEKAEKLPDRELWRQDASVESGKDARELGFDPQKWTYTGDKQVLAFNEDTWFCTPERLPDLPEAGPSGGSAREEVTIRSAEDLAEFAARVNAGEAAARNAVVRLDGDLNLGGRSWTPIGRDKAHSFRGSFDGNGHRITNFRIKDKDLEYRGFFGVLEGGAYNLTVDCAASGGGVMGALAGELLGGTIRCCGAVTSLRPNGKAEAVGGLVGISTGTIAMSYAAGHASFIPLLLLPLPLALMLIPAAAAVVTTVVVMNPPAQPVNSEVMVDIAATPIPLADLPDLPEPEQGEGEARLHSISFSTSTEITADLSTGKVSLIYQSTNRNADQKVVVRLLLSNGAVIAQTGAILPGYQITEMDLTDQAKAELTPGRYSATIHMIPYSLEDESKGFTETRVPVVLTVS